MVADKIHNLCQAVHFPFIFHPKNDIGRNVSVGEGTYIGPLVGISPDCRIGRFCSLMSTLSVCHDVERGDFCSIARGKAIGVYVEIGFATAISQGVIIIQRVIISEHTIIGAGAIVVRDIPSYGVAYGSPAKIIRSSKPEDNYL
jgi:acetyltransferase-like isoleucine patch superfamily enzyme